MDDADAFLDLIRLHPDDDGPRLVYADWLDDHGDPERAEFVRAQCALEAMPPEDAGRPGLQRRAQELLGRHGKGWASVLPGGVEDWTFRRGFIEEVRVGPQAD